MTLRIEFPHYCICTVVHCKKKTSFYSSNYFKQHSLFSFPPKRFTWVHESIISMEKENSQFLIRLCQKEKNLNTTLCFMEKLSFRNTLKQTVYCSRYVPTFVGTKVLLP